ncbi:hypothetical protein NECAME_03172 [Necator americanus]|uniref:Uncharacterized protein n=1 Tax=Necator americanus TaxID=51031 RepID=W2T6J2_NECAM|nr:hypothetical protein NECAME_03172 [Necator americanus]ETN77508.1 hypothetical protein NECAME_03172 [Necator americanus]
MFELYPNIYTHAPIRVVKAFQAGLDRREPSLTGQSAARLREISRQLRLQVENEGRGVCRIRFVTIPLMRLRADKVQSSFQGRRPSFQI